jgi:transcriptional regulator with XRE-family HTH domain
MPNDADRAGTPAGVFGAELRFYRTRAGLSQKDLAARANVSHDVISKIETGERPPAEDFPPRLDAVPELDTRGALTRLWDHLKKGQKQRLYGWFQEWADIEAQATVLRWYEPLVVPGLLQTEDYARGVLKSGAIGQTSPEDIERHVALRMQRQELLTRPDAPRFWAVMDETALRRPVGGPEVMRAQIDRLLEATKLPHVTLQVAPFVNGPHPGTYGPFVLFRFAMSELPDMVYSEYLTGAVYLDARTEVATHLEVMDRMAAQAATAQRTKEILRDLRKEL